MHNLLLDLESVLVDLAARLLPDIVAIHLRTVVGDFSSWCQKPASQGKNEPSYDPAVVSPLFFLFFVRFIFLSVSTLLLQRTRSESYKSTYLFAPHPPLLAQRGPSRSERLGRTILISPSIVSSEPFSETPPRRAVVD